MKPTSAPFLNPLDAKKVRTLLRVGALANQSGFPFLLVGAFARDIHFWHLHNIPIHRATADIDVSIQLPSWDAYHSFSTKLLNAGFEVRHAPEKFADTETEQEVDLLPFGKISPDGVSILWPDQTRWEITGLQDAFDHAAILKIGDGLLRVATLANMVQLKMVAISERPERKRDSSDIGFTIENYLAAGNRERLKGETGASIMEAYQNNLLLASAHLIGLDIASRTSPETRSVCEGFLDHEITSRSPCELATQLARNLTNGRLAESRKLLSAMLDGLSA